jgi:hypothetical protein
VLPESVARIEALPPDATVLDVGGWACPLARATTVLDQMPYETRGLYGVLGDPAAERFTAESWVRHDICARERFPFADDAFDLVVCSHTLEDVRDPVWVASELSRIGRSGYVEVPSRLQEQSWGVNGPYVGWSHHHWLVDVDQAAEHIDFVFKLHALHHPGPTGWAFSARFAEALEERERVSTLWWDGAFTARERVFDDVSTLVEWLAEPVRAHGARDPDPPRAGRRARLARRLGRGAARDVTGR